MTDEPVLISTDDSGVRTFTLNRPGALNSLTTAMKVLIRDGLHAAAADTDVRAVVVRGTGRGFCAGQDIDEMLDVRQAGGLSNTVEEHYNPIVRAIVDMPKPVIAGINGTAAGAGLSIALACDVRISAASAKFTTAFAGIGLSCDTGISWTLPRLIGRAAALDLLLRPRPIGADRALELGLVNDVVSDDEFDDALAELAAGLAAGPTLALASIKRAVNHAQTSTLDDALEFEKAKMDFTGATEDHRTAIEAFVDKTKPTFAGR